jgi:hypothetical protein
MSTVDFLVIPLLHYRHELLRKSNTFLSTAGKATDLTENDCDSIIYSLVEEFIHRYEKWRVYTKSCCYDEVVDKLLHDRFENTTDIDAFKTIRDEFYRTAIDPVWMTIRQILQPAFPEDTWNLWWIRRMNNSIILEQGIDYRIYDWERRMESGEWS